MSSQSTANDETVKAGKTDTRPSEDANTAPTIDLNTPADNVESAGDATAEPAAADAHVESESAPDPHSDVQALQQALEAAEAKAEENWERCVRVQAEMDNLRKRSERDVANAHKFGLEKIANELLGIRDSLEMGVQAARHEDAEVDKIREGTELTLEQLTKLMQNFHIQEVNPLGETFNPDLHQAISMQPLAEGQTANTVVSVMQKGYTLNERLLRPALVVVAR